MNNPMVINQSDGMLQVIEMSQYTQNYMFIKLKLIGYYVLIYKLINDTHRMLFFLN